MHRETFQDIFRILAALVLTFLTVNVKAVPWATPALPGEGLIQPEATAASRTTAHFQREDPMAAVTISLLTCSPGTEIWSLYGHTALRVQDKKRGLDVAVNWGLFSYSQPYFIPRFVFGRCDYQMGMEPMDIFLAEYREEGRGVIEQELNLSSAESSRSSMHSVWPINLRTVPTDTISSTIIVRHGHATWCSNR